MQYTVFDTPVLKSVFRLVSGAFLRHAAGGSREGRPMHRKMWLSCLSYTNWDFPIRSVHCICPGRQGLLDRERLSVPASFGPLMRWLGGMPVSRRESPHCLANHLGFSRYERLNIAIARRHPGKSPTGRPGSTISRTVPGSRSCWVPRLPAQGRSIGPR